MFVDTTVNASYEKIYSDEDLAYFVKKMIFPDDRMYVLFTECPIQDILKWIKTYDINLEILQKYYYIYIKPYYTNPELEEFFQIHEL